MRTAIYVRVSTDEQAKEGYSIRAQIDKLKDYIRIMDWDFYKVYADEGISGKNIKDRPAINELINDIKAGLVNNVLVYKIDRLTRSTRDLIDLSEIFNEYDCNFNSLMESIDTQTASGRMFLKIIGIFAEFERENIAERVTLACEKKVKEGYTLSTNISSYGYDRAVGEKVQIINSEEAKIVQEIFEMYANHNMSYSAIAKNLNSRGIKTKLGNSWHHDTVGELLKNPNYIGKVRYAMQDQKRYFEADGKHEPIISETLFYEVQKKLERFARKSPTKKPKENNYFCGTLYCGLCGEKMITHAHSKYSKKNGEEYTIGQYRCPNRTNSNCDNATFSHKKCEKAFEDYMNDIEDIKITDETLLEENSKQDSLNGLLREQTENAIAKLEKKSKDLMTLYISERISFDEYEQMVKILTMEKNGYLEQLNNIEIESDEDILLTRDGIITNFKENWQLLNNAEKFQFVQNYIEQITAVSKKEEGYQVKVLKLKFYND